MVFRRGFCPLVDKNTRILVVGTLPGNDSIRKQEYYSNTSNKIWEIILQYIDPSLTNGYIKNMCYKDKTNLILNNGIGLWDVYDSATIKSSSDSDILNPIKNDFKELLDTSPIQLIITNGNKAKAILDKNLIACTIPIISCNSTSGNNTHKTLDEKKIEWNIALNSLK